MHQHLSRIKKIRNLVIWMSTFMFLVSGNYQQQLYRHEGHLCVKCAPGFHRKEYCKNGSPTLCLPCQYNQTYTSTWNTANGCTDCTLYCKKMNSHKIANCTLTSDIICACNDGHFLAKEDHSFCLRHKTCGYGLGVSIQGTNVSDVQCELCVLGSSYSNTSSATENCKPLTDCEGLGLDLIGNGNLKKDNICGNKSNSVLQTSRESDFLNTTTSSITNGDLTKQPTTVAQPQGLNTEKIAIIIFAVILTLILMAIFGWCCLCKKTEGTFPTFVSYRKQIPAEGSSSADCCEPNSSDSLIGNSHNGCGDCKNSQCLAVDIGDSNGIMSSDCVELTGKNLTDDAAKKSSTENDLTNPDLCRGSHKEDDDTPDDEQTIVKQPMISNSVQDSPTQQDDEETLVKGYTGSSSIQDEPTQQLEVEKDILTKNRMFLIAHLEVDGVIAYLQTEGIFNTHIKEKIKLEHRTTLDQVTALLDILPRRGPDAFEKFFNALVYTEQYHIADELKPEKAPCKQSCQAPNHLRQSGGDNGRQPSQPIQASSDEPAMPDSRIDMDGTKGIPQELATQDLYKAPVIQPKKIKVDIRNTS